MGYAKHVGRVGALAVALGIGAAVATTPGVAWAEGPTEEKPPAVDGGAPGTDPDTDTSPSPTERQDPGAAIRKGIERAADDLRDGIRNAITGVVRSSGGAVTSTQRNGSNPSNGNVPPVIVKDEEQLETSKPLKDEQKSTSFTADNSANSVSSYSRPRWRAPQAQVNTLPAPKPIAKAIDDVKDVVQDSINAVTGNQTPTGSGAVGRSALTTTGSPEIVDEQQVRPGFVAPISIMTNVMNAALAPFLNPTPGQPAPQNPVLWAVLGFVRRQFQDTPFGKIVLNPRPDISYDAGENVQLPGAVVGFLNPHDRDLEPDDLDELTYQATDLDEGASLNIDDTGAFLYTPPDTWDGTTPYTDTFYVTVSDADSGPHIHGLAGLLSPNGGHTDTEKVVVTVDPLSPTGPDPVTGTVGVSLGTTTNPAIAERDGDTIMTPYGPIKLDVTQNSSGSYDVGGQFTPTDAARFQASQNQFATFRAVSAMRAMSLQAADSPEPVTQTVTVEIEGQPFTFEVPILPARYKAAEPITVGNAPFYMITKGDRLYVVNTPNVIDNTEPVTVSIIDTTTNQLVDADISTPDVIDPIVIPSAPGGQRTQPAGIVTSGNRIYIANSILASGDGTDPSTITVIDTEHNTVLAPIQLDGNPTSIAMSGDRLYVSQFGGEVKVINIQEGDDYGQYIEDEAINTGATNVYYIAVHGDTLYVSEPDFTDPASPTGTIHMISLDADSEEFAYGEEIADPLQVNGGFPGPPNVSPDYDEDGNAYIYVANVQALTGQPQTGKITVIDTKTNSVAGTVDLPSAPLNIAFSPDGSLAYVGSTDSMSVVNTATREVLFTTVADVSPDGFPNLVAVSSDGKSVYVSDLLKTFDISDPASIELGTTVSVISFATGTNTATPGITAEPDEDNVDPSTGAVPVAVTTSDDDGDALTVFVAVQPSEGHVTITPSGGGNYTVTYTPTEEARQNAANGGPTEDTFVLTVSDAQKYQTTTVTVPIKPAEESVTV
jgi:VCBS repeat-containing protein